MNYTLKLEVVMVDVLLRTNRDIMKCVIIVANVDDVVDGKIDLNNEIKEQFNIEKYDANMCGDGFDFEIIELNEPYVQDFIDSIVSFQ